MISFELDLSVNFQPFRLGDTPQLSVLKGAQCKKAGFLARRASLAASDQSVFWAKNPMIGGFGNRWALCPTQKTEFDETPPRLLCGTSAYLTYGPNGLEKVTLQVFGSELLAAAAKSGFDEHCSQRYGAPDSETDRLTIWNRNGTCLASEIGIDEKKAWVVWTVDDRALLTA